MYIFLKKKDNWKHSSNIYIYIYIYIHNVFPFAVVCLTQLKYTDGAAAAVKSKYAGGFQRPWKEILLASLNSAGAFQTNLLLASYL